MIIDIDIADMPSKKTISIYFSTSGVWESLFFSFVKFLVSSWATLCPCIGYRWNLNCLNLLFHDLEIHLFLISYQLLVFPLKNWNFKDVSSTFASSKFNNRIVKWGDLAWQQTAWKRKMKKYTGNVIMVFKYLDS